MMIDSSAPYYRYLLCYEIKISGGVNYAVGSAFISMPYLSESTLVEAAAAVLKLARTEHPEVEYIPPLIWRSVIRLDPEPIPPTTTAEAPLALPAI